MGAKDGWTGNDHGPGSLERYLTGVNAYGSFFDHVGDMSAFIKGPCAGRAIVVYYEELKTNFVDVVHRLADFLAVPLPDAKLQSLCKMTAFESMQSGSSGKGVAAVLCRKGVCGDWENAP